MGKNLNQHASPFKSTKIHTANISGSLSLNYIEMRTSSSDNLFRKELKWEEMYRLSEESAMSSDDSMILNVLDASKFNFMITLDYDLAYGVLLSTPDKNVLVPDRIYQNHIKKLRF